MGLTRFEPGQAVAAPEAFGVQIMGWRLLIVYRPEGLERRRDDRQGRLHR